MAKKVVKSKLIIVESNGAITELGGISGPIINPSLVPIPVILQMINRHRKVYEVNPCNQSEKVRLNLKNLNLNNFPEKNIEFQSATKVEPKLTTTTTVPRVKEEKNVESVMIESLFDSGDIITEVIETPKETTVPKQKNIKSDFKKK